MMRGKYFCDAPIKNGGAGSQRREKVIEKLAMDFVSVELGL